MATKKKSQLTKKRYLNNIYRFLPWLLIACGTIALLASVILTFDKINLLQNPGMHFNCDLNPIISCGSVMESKQAHVFGFMNPIIGLIGFPVVITTGVVMLAGAKLKRWYWLGLQIGLSLGMLFAYWLLYESIFSIRALCPWCLTTDVVITTAWWYVTLFCLYEGYIKIPSKLKSTGEFIKRHHTDILIFWFLLVIVLILQHFWYYFGQHI